MPKPSVSILHYTAPPIIGGVEHVIADHAFLFTEAGYAVTIITGRAGDADAMGDATIVQIPELDSDDPDNRQIAEAINAGRVSPEFRALQARIQEALVPVLNTDVLIVHNVLNFHFNLPLTAALYRLLDRHRLPPTIAWCHDISRYVNPASGDEQRSGFPWDFMRTYRPEVTYVAVSSRRQQMLADTLGVSRDLIKVIPNGVAPELLLGLGELTLAVVAALNLYAADLILLMPIRITRAKNIEFAMQVTRALKSARLSPKLVVTGPPDPHAADSAAYLDELLALRRDLDVQHEVAFLYQGVPDWPGPLTIDPATVSELYRVADIVFMPSHREGFGLPVLEGGLAHRGVFVTEVPAVDEVGAELVHLIAEGETPDQVAGRMREWMDRGEEQRLQRRVRREYTWQAIFADKIEPLIAERAGLGERKS